MKCPICKHGNTKPGRVTAVFDLPGGSAVVFREVPAEVCEVCGERYFDEATTARLLRQAKLAASTGTEVEVRLYAA